MFSWAQIVAPAECIHSLPSVWSMCQWVLMRTLDGVGVDGRESGGELGLRRRSSRSRRGAFRVLVVRRAMLPPAPPMKVTLRRRGVVVILLLALAARDLVTKSVSLLGWRRLGPQGAAIEARGRGGRNAGAEKPTAGDRLNHHVIVLCIIVEDTSERPSNESVETTRSSSFYNLRR